MSTLAILPQAQQDIDDIYDYIARRDRRPQTADKVVSELTEACRSCADMTVSGSLFGTLRRDLGEDYRVFAHKR
jgi:plasmid stabilization system protein ParE